MQQVLLSKAAALKIEVPQSEIDTQDAEARKNIPPDTFQQELVQRGLTAADMREGLRRELLARKVIEQEVDGKVVVTDKDVTDFFNANRGAVQRAGRVVSPRADRHHAGARRRRSPTAPATTRPRRRRPRRRCRC